jgi:hypothetical protein
MNGSSLSHPNLMSAIELIADRVAPVVREKVASAA